MTRWRSFALCLVLCGLTASMADAQLVQFRGKIEDAENVCYYCPGYTWILDGTKISLSSSTYNIASYYALQVVGEGIWNGSVTTPTINITSMTVTSETCTVGGGTIGDTMDFTAYSPEGDLAVIAAMLTPVNVTAFGLFQNQVVVLDQNNFVLVGVGTTDEDGEFNVEVTIPQIPALNGFKVTAQALILPAGGTPFMSNPDYKILSLL